MCGIVNRPTVQHCECGHDFEAPEHLESFLQSRLVTGWVMVVGGLLLTIVSVLFIVVGIPVGDTPKIAVFSRVIAIAATMGSVALFVKGTRVVDAAGISLRDLRSLPSAKVIERAKKD